MKATKKTTPKKAAVKKAEPVQAQPAAPQEPTKEDAVKMTILTDEHLNAYADDISKYVLEAINDDSIENRDQLIKYVQDKIGVKYLDIDLVKNADGSIFINANKKFLVGTIKVTKIDYPNEDSEGERIVFVKEVFSNTDLANDPATSDKLMNEVKKELANAGWFFSDEDAILNAYLRIECALDCLRGGTRMDKLLNKDSMTSSISDRLLDAYSKMRYINTFNMRRNELSKQCNELPDILPDIDEWDEWEVVDRKLTKVGHPIQIKRLEIPEDKRKQINDLFSSIIGGEKKD